MDNFQINLNPRNLNEYVGNERVKRIIRITLDVCKKKNFLLPHTLITGPRGTGKTTLATLIAKELGMSYRIMGANSLVTVSDVNNLFVFNLPKILILDEIHNIRPFFSDMMHSALDSFEYTYMDEDNNPVTVHTGEFSLISMTTDEGKISAPLYSRFRKKFHLRPYTDANLQTIIMNACKNNNIEIDSLAASEIAFRSNGIPRLALLHMLNVYDYAEINNNSKIDYRTACDALDLHEIDTAGLDPIQRDLLSVLANSEKPMGAQNLAERCGIGISALLNIYEPYLLKVGMLERRSTGRVITSLGRTHILKNKQ